MKHDFSCSISALFDASEFDLLMRSLHSEGSEYFISKPLGEYVTLLALEAAAARLRQKGASAKRPLRALKKGSRS